MRESLTFLILMILNALRKLWQRFTGKVPVPVRVRSSRRMIVEPASHFLSSRVLFDLFGPSVNGGRRHYRQ